MKIVYVGDNRHRGNYGCRATSTALSQIISQKNKIVGRIYGDYTNVDMGDLFFCKYYPSFIYRWIGRSKHLDLFRSFFYSFHRIVKGGKYYFSRYDFISLNLDRSIENLIKCLPANPNLKEFDLRQYDFDALVVNGEGSFIFSTPPWRECLIEAMLMRWAQKMGKKVFYLNGMLSDDPYSPHNEKCIKTIHEVFKKTEVVAVREMQSFEYAKRYFPDVNLKYYPDALFSWYKFINDDFEIDNGRYFNSIYGAEDEAFYNLDFSKKYILIAGSSSVGNAVSGKYENAINSYVNLVNSTKKKFKDKNVYLIQVCEGDSFLRDVAKETNTPLIALDTPILAAGKILSRADLFISGRYHPAILASLGGTPCVFMSSNSHKTKSIQELLMYKKIKEFSEIPNDKEIFDMLELGEELINQGTELRMKIKKRCKELSVLTEKQVELFYE